MAVFCAATAASAAAQTACNTVPSAPLNVAVPGSPFQIVSSPDGCWIFASMARKGAGVAVLRRSEGSLELTRTAKINPLPRGIVMTHDGKLLIAATIEGIVLLDVDRLITGKGEPVIESVRIGKVGPVCVNVTRDDRFLFVSDETGASISVIDLALARTNRGAGSILGRIPVGIGPIALTFSPGGRWLYTTSQSAVKDWNWPAVCDAEDAAPDAPKHPRGAIVVVDVAKAETDPAHAVASRVAAGCNPVRLAISPDGSRAYVTARKTAALLVFDTGKLIADPEHAQVAQVPVGSAPVPVVVTGGGKTVLVGNSNRFGNASQSSTLSVIDTDTNALAGSIAAGAFPRDLVLSPDGRTLFVANFASNSLQMMDAAKLPVR